MSVICDRVDWTAAWYIFSVIEKWTWWILWWMSEFLLTTLSFSKGMKRESWFVKIWSSWTQKNEEIHNSFPGKEILWTAPIVSLVVPDDHQFFFQRWYLQMSHSYDRTRFGCSVHRPEGRSYLFFMSFKLEVEGADISQAHANVSRGMNTAENRISGGSVPHIRS